jgi:hypothetical protein
MISFENTIEGLIIGLGIGIIISVIRLTFFN